VLNGEVFGRQIETLVFGLCGSWRSSSRAAVLSVHGGTQSLRVTATGI